VLIFQNVDGIGKNGFVSPRGKGYLQLSLGGVDKQTPITINMLNKEYNLSTLSEISIHRVIKNYVSFVAKAKRYILDNHQDDAFLHFVIALDLVFGIEGQSTESVASRVAVLTYHKFNKTYVEQQRTLKDIYSKRSKYVHNGKSVNRESVKQVELICSEVLYCLLRLQKDEKNRANIELDKWLKDLDFIVAAFDSGRVSLPDLLTECGIL
jgi:hypothetical protein